jgi:hypothetical protein
LGYSTTIETGNEEREMERTDYTGWHIEATVMADELGDTSGCDEAATYDLFRAMYKDAIEFNYPGCTASVRQSGNMGIRSLSEYPRIEYPDEIDLPGEEYEEMRVDVQGIGEDLFASGSFWVVTEADANA